MSVRRVTHKWHRYIGLLISLSVMVLLLTGILLNHTSELKLNQHYLHNPALLNWYGIKPPKITSFRSNELLLASDGMDIYTHDQRLATCEQFGGIYRVDNELHVDCGLSRLIINLQGELLENLDSSLAISLSASNQLSLTTTDEQFRQSVMMQSRAYRINAEQLLLDIHSGRIFGETGPWLVDTAALLLLGLAISGLFMGFRRR